MLSIAFTLPFWPGSGYADAIVDISFYHFMAFPRVIIFLLAAAMQSPRQRTLHGSIFQLIQNTIAVSSCQSILWRIYATFC
jgi:hypothetical protein